MFGQFLTPMWSSLLSSFRRPGAGKGSSSSSDGKSSCLARGGLHVSTCVGGLAFSKLRHRA